VLRPGGEHVVRADDVELLGVVEDEDADPEARPRHRQ